MKTESFLRIGLRGAVCAGVFVTLVALVPLTAWALDLDAAKAQLIVGETEEGYLAAVASTPEAQELVARVNAERKARYAEIAKRNNTPVAAVEALAGKKAIEMTPAGQMTKVDGKWVKK
ncbi:MAG: YdbL family protein [Bdellovibrionota bacterium]